MLLALDVGKPDKPDRKQVLMITNYIMKQER